MAAKRKGSDLVARLEAAKKAKEPENKSSIRGCSLDLLENETKHEYFNRIYNSTPQNDIMLEWIEFLKQFPKLFLDIKGNEILSLVAAELKISDIKKNFSIDNMVRPARDGTPLLDALSYKLGFSLNFMCPPTKSCLLCGKYLSFHHEGTQVVVHSLSGPTLATKLIWRCRKCTGMWKLAGGNQVQGFQAGDVNYHPDMFGNSKLGMKFYPESRNVSVTRGSSETYFDCLVVEGHFQELHHGWLSSESKAEAYNSTFRDTEKSKSIKSFFSLNPDKGVHFLQEKNQEDLFHADDDKEINEESPKEDKEYQEYDEMEPGMMGNTAKKVKLSRIWEMKRKSLKQALYYQKIKEELKRRQLTETYVFAENGKTLAGSAKEFMVKIDELSKDELYEHKEENCFRACRKRGCKWVVTVDGLWKLSYPICMWDNSYAYPEDITKFVPNVCPEEPAHLAAFCKKHCLAVEDQGKPSGLRQFIKSCGANPESYNKDGKSKVQTVLEQMSKINNGKNDLTFADTQGVTYLLRSKEISNKENFEEDIEGDENTNCRKDIGETERLRRRSRGYEAFVTGGGIIKKFGLSTSLKVQLRLLCL